MALGYGPLERVMNLREGCRTMCGMDTAPRKPYLTDISDEDWAFAAPYLTLMRRSSIPRIRPIASWWAAFQLALLAALVQTRT